MRIKPYESQVDVQPNLKINPHDPNVASMAGRSLSLVGDKLSGLGQALHEMNVSDDIQEATKAMSEAHLALTKDFHHDLNAGTLDVEGFEGKVSKALSTVKDNLKTTAGRNYVEKNSATLKNHFLQSVIAGRAEQTKEKTILSHSETINNFGNNLLDDPDAFNSINSLYDGYVKQIAESKKLPPNLVAKLRAEGMAELSKSAVRGWIGLSPSIALKQLRAGQWDKNLESETKSQLIAEAERGLKAQQIDHERMDFNARKAKEEKLKSLQNEFLNKMATGELTAKEILASDLEPIGQGSKEHFLNVIKSNLKEENRVLNRSGTFNAIYYRIHLPDSDPDKITDQMQLMQYVGKGLRMDELGALSNEIKSAVTNHGKGISIFKRQLLDEAKKRLTRSNPMYGYEDQTGEEQLRQFNHYMMERLAEAKNPRETRDMLDPRSDNYIGLKLTNFVKSPSQQLADVVKAKKKPVDVDPAKKRLPNESIQEYLKRNGKK